MSTKLIYETFTQITALQKFLFIRQMISFAFDEIGTSTFGEFWLYLESSSGFKDMLNIKDAIPWRDGILQQ